MSFSEITKASVAKKKKDFTVEYSGKQYQFSANEINYFQKLQLAAMSQEGKESFTSLIVACITDKDGKRMTIEQASQLPDEIAEKFIIEASEVNAGVAEKKN